MSTFPTDFDPLDVPDYNDKMGDSSPTHPQDHTALRELADALQIKVGKDGDTNASSLDKRVSDLEADTSIGDHLSDPTDAHDASAISILDVAGDFTATDVEGALAELQSDAESHLIGDTHTGYLKESDVAAKGDLYVATANDTVGILTAGTDGHVLTADSGESTGLIWQPASASPLTPTYISSNVADVDNTGQLVLASSSLSPAVGDIFELTAVGYIDNPVGVPDTPTYIWRLYWTPDVEAATQVLNMTIDSNQDGSSQDWAFEATIVVTAVDATRIMGIITHNIRSDGSTKATSTSTTSIADFQAESGTFDFWVYGQNGAGEDITVESAIFRQVG